MWRHLHQYCRLNGCQRSGDQIPSLRMPRVSPFRCRRQIRKYSQKILIFTLLYILDNDDTKPLHMALQKQVYTLHGQVSILFSRKSDVSYEKNKDALVCVRYGHLPICFKNGNGEGSNQQALSFRNYIELFSDF